MEEIKNYELKDIKGGAISWGLVAGIGAAITFFIGLFDCYTNPIKCRLKK